MKKGKDTKYKSMTWEAIVKHMTGQERKFVEYYEATGDRMLSAMDARYTDDPQRAAEIGGKLLSSPKIKAYRRLRILDLYEKRNLSAEAVILRIDDLYRRAVCDVPHMTRNKETKENEPDGTWMYDSKDAINTLKLLGNVYGVFGKKTADSEVPETIEDYLQRLGETDE